MKKIFLTILTILSIQNLYAQLAFTTFYTKKGKETKNQEEAYYSREVSILDNSFVRVSEVYLHNNRIKLLGTYPSFKEKWFIGQKFEGYDNGKIKAKEFYSHDGKLIDTAYYYYPNGKLKIAFEYPHKQEKEITKITDTLILVYNDSLGNRKLINGNGYAEIDLENSVIERGDYQDHKRIGKWTGTFMDGKYSFEEEYSNGILISGVSKDSLNVEYKYDAYNAYKEPDYPQGMQSFRQFIGYNYKYPKEAINARVKGTLKMSFVVEKDGKLTDIKVEEDLGFGTGEAGISVLRRSKKWSPGVMRGVPVRVAYSIPIRLDLSVF